MRVSPASLVSAVGLGLALILAGCDAAGPTDTVILSENSPEAPTVEYSFFYDTNGSAAIGVRSDEADNLSSILEENGFRRSDVVSARVDSVKLERISPKGVLFRKVFDYLTGATVHLGANADGPRIAEAAFQTTDRSVTLPVRTADVTDVVKSGPSPAFLRLDTADDAPDQRRDRVEVTVYFRIEVRGV
jgi:hypothetical protein